MEWNEREILRYLGHRGQEIPENVEELIKECERELEQMASPRAMWKEYPLSIHDHVLDMGFLQTKSKSLERNLRDCERVILFAATLGSRVDVLLHRYNMIQMSKAVVMQAASVAMLETFCDGIFARVSAPDTGIFRLSVSVRSHRRLRWESESESI